MFTQETPAAADDVAQSDVVQVKGWLRIVTAAVDSIVVVTLVVQIGVLVLDVIGLQVRQFYLPATLEISELDMMVLTFIGAISAYARREHVAVHGVLDRLPDSVRQSVESATEGITLAVAAVVGFSSIGEIHDAASQVTPVLQLSMAWFYLPVPIAMAGIAAICVDRLARTNLKLMAFGLSAAIAIGALYMAVTYVLGATSSVTVGMLVLFGVLILLLVAGAPIAICLLAGALAYLRISDIAPTSAVPINMTQAVNSYVLVAVPLFVLVGFLLTETGVSKRLADALTACVGWITGGLYHVLIVGTFIFSGLTGAKVADIIAVGTPMRDVLDRQHYPRAETAAVLASSAAAGETIPPSISLIVLASVTSVSLSAVFSAGILPAILISLALMATVWVRARRARLAPVERASVRTALELVIRAIPVAVIPVVIVAGIISGIATATEVSAVAVLLCLAVATVLGDKGWIKRMPSALARSSSMSGMILFLVAAAGPSSWCITLAQVPQHIAVTLASLRGNSFVFLMAAAAALVVFGSILEGLPAVVIFGPLLMPVASELGVNQVQFAIVMIISLGLGAFAPPIGVGFNVACAVARVPVHRAGRAMIPYLIVVFVAIMVVAFVPAITSVKL
jgi:tripartite ATP-independent transporter DctM subunit